MPKVTGDIVIDRPVEEVFDFAVDARNEPLYNPDLLRSEKLTDGPVGAGTRFRASHRQGHGTVEMAVEITRLDRPRRMASRTTMPWSEVDGELTFEAVSTGTRMRWAWDVRLKGCTRALTPLVGFIGRHQERACWRGLKRYVETHPAPSSGPLADAGSRPRFGGTSGRGG